MGGLLVLVLVVCFVALGLASYFQDGFRSPAKRAAKETERGRIAAEVRRQQQHHEALERQFQQDMQDARFLDGLARQEIERCTMESERRPTGERSE